jgi:hypothetical protein
MTIRVVEAVWVASGLAHTYCHREEHKDVGHMRKGEVVAWAREAAKFYQ